MTGTLQRGVAIAAAAILLIAIGWTVLRPVGSYRVTAYFTQTVGLYKGSDVRILGIPVGTITDVEPMGDRVRVDMEIDDTYAIPAEAEAVVLAPSLVSDRYVQFAPVYDGGATMKDGATVPLKDTATPVELDSARAKELRRRLPGALYESGRSQFSMRVPDDPAQRFPAVVQAADELLAVVSGAETEAVAA
jgi:virulence factor Mce-like protein